MKHRRRIAIAALGVVLATCSWGALVVSKSASFWDSVFDTIGSAKGACHVKLREGVFETNVQGIPLIWQIENGSYAEVDFRFDKHQLEYAKVTLRHLDNDRKDTVNITIGTPAVMSGPLRSITYEKKESVTTSIDSDIKLLKADANLSDYASFVDSLRTTEGAVPHFSGNLYITLKEDISPIKEILFSSLQVAFRKDFSLPIAHKVLTRMGRGYSLQFSEVKYNADEDRVDGQITEIRFPQEHVLRQNLRFSLDLGRWQ